MATPNPSDPIDGLMSPSLEDCRLAELNTRIDEVVDFMVKLSSGHTHVRLAPSPAMDALDSLIVGLNMMGEELEALTGDLEAAVAARTRELAQAREELEFLALHDALTGLANRVLFADRLAEATADTARPPRLAVLVLDLDGFKAINDSLGHQCGDRLLIAVARRLTAAVRHGDTVSRLGGDEFAIILCDADRRTALRIARRVRQSVAEPILIDGQHCRVTASVGIRLAPPVQTMELLLRDADTAMYSVKARSSGEVAVYEPS